MPWYSAGTADLDRVLAFLMSQEWSCVGFTSQLRNGRRARLPNRRAAVVHFYTERDLVDPICAAVLETTHGFCYPVLAGLSSQQREPVVRELAPRLETALGRYPTFMGLAEDVEALERTIGRPPRHRVEYYMMQAVAPPGSRQPPRLSREPLVREAGPADTRRLLPLQAKYEREEVLLPNRALNMEATRRQLRSDLKQQVVYLTELNGVPIAKAGTNARGFRYDQIGGVFTEPEYRGCGVGGHLMEILMRRVRQEGKAVSLFVKTQNHAARRMYRNLGFNDGRLFVISYYH